MEVLGNKICALIVFAFAKPNAHWVGTSPHPYILGTSRSPLHFFEDFRRI